MGETEDERTAQASQLFENFVQMSTCKGTLQAFSILCRQLELDPLDCRNFYSSLKAAVNSWKVKALWTKLDNRAQQKVYNQNKVCQGTRCLIIGGGPCGLRTAIELALLGCKVVVIEKRDTFSRNNVLHLWPFTIEDLRGLGAKKFYGKFCAGAIDHISIRQLQLMLLKVCLILGVEVHVGVEFIKLLEPSEKQADDSHSWRADVRPSYHSISDFDFDVVIGADGRKNTLDGFGRKEFRGKLAIAITANFVNRNTTAEAKVEEISGVAFIFNQKFFLELKEETGIDLENIVYYKDNTHYFVMTAKKHSLLDKGVIINDYIETERLLSTHNVNQEALLSYAREAADFGTNYQLPSLDYAINHYGQPDVAMFDFTSMYASENAALIREKHGHQLLVALVGDSLLEPFWPMGTGCARGFLAAFDTAWMVKGFAQGKNPLEILAERESIYRLLPQTTTENISKNFDQYTIDPATRYPNLNSTCVRPHQVRHLFCDGQWDSNRYERHIGRPVNLSRGESEVRPDRLLTWCQRQTQGYRGVNISNLTSSWRSGLALCALIHRQRPELIDYDSLNEDDVAANNQLAFDVAEHQLGIQPVTTGKEVALEAEPDKLLMVLYLSKFYEAFWNSPGSKKGAKETDENSEEQSAPSNVCHPRKRIPRDDKKIHDDSMNKRRRKGNLYLTELSCHSAPSAGEDKELRENRVRSMATQLLAKFEENSTEKMHSKNKAERLSTREFAKKTIKERAVLLLSTFTCSSKPTPPPLCSLSEAQDEQSTSLPLSKSTSMYPVVHPVPDPTVQAGFSPAPISPLDRKDMKEPPFPLFYADSDSCHADSPSTSLAPTEMSCSNESQDIASPLPEISFSTGPVCALSEDNAGTECRLENKYVHKSARERSNSHICECDANVKFNGSCHLEAPKGIVQKSVICSESCPTGAASYSKERTVGRVSSAINAKAQILAILYETDHRPNAAPCVGRGFGGSDICHFCAKRVYVMERLSAEGYFFHRECFRCDVCNCTLRLGGYTFDSHEAKFYCRMHYAQHQSSTHFGRFRKRKDNHSHVTSLVAESGSNSATSSIQTQPPDRQFKIHSEHAARSLTSDLGDTNMAVEKLTAHCIVKPAAQDEMGPNGEKEDSAEGQCKTKQCHCWKHKIRAIFPLAFVKHFHRSWPQDKEGPATVPEADSDFEEIAPTEKLSSSKEKTSCENKHPSEGSEKNPTQLTSNSSTPKKRLILSVSENERLLRWDMLTPTKDTLITPDTETTQQHEHQIQAKTEADKPQADSGQHGEPTQSQTSYSASSPSAFQLFANAFRRTFSVTNPSNSSSTAHMRRIRHGPRRQRPMSEGALHFNSHCSASDPESSKETHSRQSDMPSRLQQVSLMSRRNSGGVFKDDVPSLSRRKVSLFSSLRLRKREASEADGKDQELQKEIRMILTNLRNKASRQQKLEEPCSSDDEHGIASSNHKVSCERKHRRQGTTVDLQAKREQLKRLHRAQVIQRQLEEVGEKQRDVEDRGVAIEKVIREEAGDSQADDGHHAQLYQSWFKLVLEKNRLARYESELMIFAQELELEDTQGRLQQDLRRRMTKEDTKKSASELQEEQAILSEIMRTVEKRDMLVSMLEEQRLKERAEDQDLESIVLSKGYEFHWAQANDSWGSEEVVG
ncbi:F-actin-monooxygenase mical2b isoform X1 [Dunckerocampus dactyliophorus]|uniref:F-actin-monooxygenase mical2b isoform X1 n=1 Tax=Dunckerocampus dactyliophorus TaxID=161453 RepID=UPI00240524F2|nr:F-actin-monooxygenase mical2b isoform X1 [Dunckerocampus dactyliophorus]